MKSKEKHLTQLYPCRILPFLLIFGFLLCVPQQSLWGQTSLSLKQQKVPLFYDRVNQNLLEVQFMAGFSQIVPMAILIEFTDDSRYDILDSVFLHQFTGSRTVLARAAAVSSCKILFENLSTELDSLYSFGFDFVLNENAPLEESFSIASVIMTLSDGSRLRAEAASGFRYRPLLLLRAAGQDHCHTYRIPGLVTTNTGTLIAVYDARYHNSKDLQEDVDIAMSRSTDGGQHWEAMKVIMDMGEWGGRPQNLNGVGDPSILYDPNRHTLWVAALWLSGSQPDKALWWESQPGMEPHETGQFMLVKSTDDGLSWSQPINITGQIKDPAWQLLLAGPGRGITLEDGTLVFPAQFKSDLGVQAIDGGKYTCQSTIVFSRDGGLSWTIGKGAKPNTTEAQVVQLEDGALMLNMRDDLNRRQKGNDNGRAIAISRDMGNSWALHPSSNHALIEPNCMASLINVKSDKGSFLLFSNPADVFERRNMTVKASFDEGLSWPEEHQILLNENIGFGYSCLSLTNDGCVGIVYEGESALFFQKIPLTEFVINR